MQELTSFSKCIMSKENFLEYLKENVDNQQMAKKCMKDIYDKWKAKEYNMAQCYNAFESNARAMMLAQAAAAGGGPAGPPGLPAGPGGNALAPGMTAGGSASSSA